MKKEIKIVPEIQWAVICDHNDRTSVHNTYEKAQEKRKFLNEEYKGCFKHKIIKVRIKKL